MGNEDFRLELESYKSTDLIRQYAIESAECSEDIVWLDEQVKQLGLFNQWRYQMLFWDNILAKKHLANGIEEIVEAKNCAYERIRARYQK